MDPEKPLNQQAWAGEMKEIRALLLIEISKEWPLMKERADVVAHFLPLILNIIHSLDDVLDSKGMSWIPYRQTWLGLFELLAELGLKPLLIEKIKDSYGPDCFFLRHILKDTE